MMSVRAEYKDGSTIEIIYHEMDLEWRTEKITAWLIRIKSTYMLKILLIFFLLRGITYMYLSNSQGVAILKHCKHVFTNILSLATPLKFYEDLHIFFKHARSW